MDCSTLKSLPSLVTIPHFPTSIDSTTDVAAASGNPEYCDVKGMIAPQTHFEMKLPVSTWQGRYLQNGCGGLLRDGLQPDVPGLRRATRR